MEEKSRRPIKFNIVDVIVLLIIVVGVVFLGVKVLGSRGGGEAAAKTRIEYTVLVRAVHPDACESIMSYREANSQLMASGELLDGYVTDITYGPHLVYDTDGQGNAVVSEESGDDARMDMVFTIQAGIDDAVLYRVGTQEVRIGKGHIVKTVDFELEGYSTTILTRETIQ